MGGPRKWIVATVLVALIAGGLIGVPQTGAQSSQELIIGFTPDPVNLDNRFTPSVQGQAISFHIVETLVFRDDNMNIVPRLAESWTYVNPTTLRLNLRRNVTFHNGEPFTAASVKYTLEDTIKPDSRTWIRAMLEPIEAIEVVDDHTVVIRSKFPFRPLLNNLALVGILPAKAGAELGERMATRLIGTGPYKLVEYVPAQRVVVERNEQYWGQKPTLRKITWRIIPEVSTRIAALETGEVAAINLVPPDQIERLAADQRIRIEATPTVRIVYIGIRNGRRPLYDIRVRQAMNLAINKEELIRELFKGKAGVSKGPVPSMTTAARTDLGPWPYDPAKARTLLREAGYPDGFEVTFAAPKGRLILDNRVAEAVAGYLGAIGIKVKLEILEWGVMRPEIYKGNASRFDLYLTGWGVTTADPDYAMKDLYYTKFAAQTNGFSNKEVDRLLDEAARTLDKDRMGRLYSQAQALVWRGAPFIFLYEQPEIWAVRNHVKNLAPRSDELTLFHRTRID